MTPVLKARQGLHNACVSTDPRPKEECEHCTRWLTCPLLSAPDPPSPEALQMLTRAGPVLPAALPSHTSGRKFLN